MGEAAGQRVGPNGTAKWVAIIMALLMHTAVMAYSWGVLGNEVRHLRTDVTDLKQDFKDIIKPLVENLP